MAKTSFKDAVFWFSEAFAWVDKDEKPMLWVLFFGHVLAVVAEAGGAGLMYLYFSFALEPQKIQEYESLFALFSASEAFNQREIMIAMTFAVMCIFILRTITLAFTRWLSLSLVLRMERRIIPRLFDYYINLNLIEHQRRKTSDMISNIWSNAASSIASCTLGILEILSGTILIIGFAVVLILAEPQAASVAMVFVTVLVLIYWMLVSKKISKWGERTVDRTRRLFSIVNEAFPAFKTVKVYSLEDKFSHSFRSAQFEQTALQRLNEMFKEMPRLVLEVVVVVAVLGMIGMIFIQGGNAQRAIPSLVLFGLAAVRIVPAISRVVGGLQQFRFTIPALQTSLADYRNSITAGESDCSGHIKDITKTKTIEKLSFEKVSFSYPDQKQPAISDVTFHINRGEFIGFAGRSGSGKTTASDILLGLIKPTSGQLSINGTVQNDLSTYRDLMSFVPQEPFIFSDTARENIVLSSAGNKVESEYLYETISNCDLENVIGDLSNGIETSLGDGEARLSGGEAQRLNLARAIYSKTDLLILDEPTSALDSTTEKTITDTLLRLRGKRTVILIAHRLHTLQFCDRIFFFNDGKIERSGSFHELLRDSVDFKEMVDALKFQSNEQRFEN